MNLKPRCITCTHFDQQDLEKGICHLNPPSPFLIGPKQTVSILPSVSVQGWCSHYKAGLAKAMAMPPEMKQ